MGFVRQAAVAGQFYPGDAATLTSTVEKFLADAAPFEGSPPKALIAPHAGYVYSGPIAASAYATIRSLSDIVERVVLLGPCHRVAVQGLALSSADSFTTPIGGIPLDKEASRNILKLPQVTIFDETHKLEHSLEVHLPFLQVILDDFKLVPLVVGQATPEAVGDVLDVLWGGPETLIVVSSDLSHYLNYEQARALDRQTCNAIENLNAGAIDRNGACGRFPVGGLLDQAKKRGLSVRTVDVRNSGDTAGSKDRVVGYGSWLFMEPRPEEQNASANPSESVTDETAEETETAPPENEVTTKPRRAINIKLGPVTKVTAREPEPEHPADLPVEEAPPAPLTPSPAPLDEAGFENQTRQLLASHGPNLLLLAALSIDNGLDHGAPLDVNVNDHHAELRAQGASFVTLKKNGNLRGCIGSPQAHRPLVVDVAQNAFRAAFADPRFPKLAADERENIDISISVLSPAVPMSFEDEKDFLRQLRPGVDGLIIEDMELRSLFLPSVWAQLPGKSDFVGRLKIKAGMKPDHWSGNFRAMRFIAEEVSASELG